MANPRVFSWAFLHLLRRQEALWTHRCSRIYLESIERVGEEGGWCGSCEDDQHPWGFVPCVVGPCFCDPVVPCEILSKDTTHIHTHTDTHRHAQPSTICAKRQLLAIQSLGITLAPRHEKPISCRSEQSPDPGRPEEANIPSLRTHKNLGKGRDVCCAVLRSSRYREPGSSSRQLAYIIAFIIFTVPMDPPWVPCPRCPLIRNALLSI